MEASADESRPTLIRLQIRIFGGGIEGWNRESVDIHFMARIPRPDRMVAYPEVISSSTPIWTGGGLLLNW